MLRRGVSFLARSDGNVAFARRRWRLRGSIVHSRRRDDLDVWRDGFVCQLEPHLVVAFPCSVEEAIRRQASAQFA